MTDLNGRPTIASLAHIAELSGVSVSTVSRALAGSPLVAEETRVRIAKLAAELGFRPNELARNLRTGTTRTIGVVLPLGHEVGQHLNDPFFLTLIGHLADRLAGRGHDLLLSRVIPADDRWLERLARSSRCDGLVVIGQSDQLATIEQFAAIYQPMVIWGAVLPGMRQCAIGSDNRGGARAAAAHLIASGRRRLAFFGDPAAPEIAERYAGVLETCAKAGLPPPELLPTHLTPDPAFVAAAQRFASAPTPDGIVAASDMVAMSAIRAAAEQGLTVPEDVAITGFDDVSFAAHTSPPLTTVRQDLEHASELIVDHLFRRIAGEATKPEILKTTLVVRGSAP